MASSAVTTVAVAGLAGQAPVSADVVFKDVASNHYAKDAIGELVTKGIVKGFPDGTFRPQQALLREHAAALLVRSLDLKSSTTNEQYFKDVPKTSSYFGSVSALREAGVFLGDHQGNFHPKTSLTREEMATILVRAFNLKAQAGVEVKLKDLDKVAKSHKENVNILYQNGITIGYGDGSFRPKNAVNRADFAVFISRALTLGTQGKTIEAITDNGVTIEGTTYRLSSSLQDLFTSNKDSLVGSKIAFQTNNNQITGITALELATANKAFDGKGYSLAGNLKVAAPNVTVKNVSVTGNLEVSEKATGTVSFDNVTVKGATALTSAAGTVSAAAAATNTVTFKNSTLSNVTIANKGLAVNFQGTTTVKALEVQTDATVKADQSVVLPNVTVSERAQIVTLEATITDLTLKNRRDLQLKTVGNINQMKVESLHPITLDLHGKIETLAPVKNSALTLNLAQGSTVGQLKLPEGVEAKDLIKNYDQVKQAFGAQPPGGSFVPGPSIPAPTPEEPAPTLVEWDSAENPFENNGVYTTDYVITPVDGATYGAEAAGSEAIIEGNVEIKGDIVEPITLKNLVIKGKLVLDAGEESSVELINVIADEIEILSGKKGTIHLNGVQSNAIVVKDDNGVRLSTNGVNVISKIEVAPTNSSSESDVELAGNFNNATIVVKDETKITAKAGFSAQAIEIETKNPTSEVKLVSTTGSFADVQEVTVKRAATVSSTGNTKIQNIVVNIPQSEQNNTVTLKGENLQETEVAVKTPSTLNVNAGIAKVSTAANVTIGGDRVADIKAVETTNNASVTAANESVQTIFDTMKQQTLAAALEEIQELPERATIGFDDITRVLTARKNVNTALSYGATNADFIVDDVNYLEKLVELEDSLATMMSAIAEVQRTIRLLPTDPSNVQAIALAGLQTRVTAVDNAIAAALEAGVTQEDIEQVRDYGRLVEAKKRVAFLVTERDTVRDHATAELAKIPAVDEITFSNVLAVQQLLVDVRRAIAQAADRGVIVDGGARLAAADAKVRQLLAERDDAVRAVRASIDRIPSEITYSNLEAARTLVAEAKTAVEAAKAKAAVETAISNLPKLTAATTRIAQLDQGTREAITAANVAIAALPAVADVNMTNIADAEAKVAAAKQAIETAKAKNAKDADFENLQLLTAVEEKIASLVTERTAAIEAANGKIALVPAEVTYANLAVAKDLISEAKAAIEAAKTKGATDAHFVGLETYNQAVAKVAELEEEKRQAIVAVNEALAALPAVTEVTYANLAQVEAQLARLHELIETAKAKTAVDADFVGLAKTTALQERIDHLQATKAEALAKANEAIASLPALAEITFANLGDVRAKLKVAVARVAEAKQFGVTEVEITGFDRIALITEKVEALEVVRAEAIEKANHEINALPAVTQISYANLSEMNQRAQAVRGLVTAAKANGADDSSFVNLAKLTAFEAKVKEMLEAKATAIAAANSAIAAIPAVEAITAETVANAQALITVAREKVAVAREHGAALTEFTNYAKIAEAQAKVDLLLTTLDEAIEKANERIQSVPLTEAITFATLDDATEKTTAARAAVELAKQLGAPSTSFINLDRLTKAEAKVADLAKQKAEAIAKANEALAVIPEAKDINVENFRALMPKMQVAVDLVDKAKAKGAVAVDLVGVERLQPAKDKASQFFVLMQAEIQIANQAIAHLPAITEITYFSLDAAKAKVAAVELAIQSAKAAGAVDADFVNLGSYQSFKNRVTELAEDQQAAIQTANEKLGQIPVQSLITPSNLAETKELVAAAQEAMGVAKHKGAAATDFVGLNNLTSALAKIQEIEAGQAESLAKANAALAALPVASTVTEANLQETRMKVNAVQNLLKEARDLGITDSQFVGLDRLTVLLDRLGEFGISLDEALSHANELLVDLKEFGAVTEANAKDAQVVYLTAYLAVKEAMSLGAKASDFDQQGYERYLALEVELENFKPQRPIYADPVSSLAEIINNPTGFSFHHLQTAVNQAVSTALFEEYRREIVTFLAGDEELTLAALKDLVKKVHDRHIGDIQEVLNVINNNIENLTHSLLGTLAWTYEENFETVRNLLVAAKDQKQGPLTRDEVAKIVQDSTHGYAFNQVVTNPEFTLDLLSWAVNYKEQTQIIGELLNQYRQAVSKAVASGSLTTTGLRQVIVGVNESVEKDKLAFINQNLPAVTPADFEPIINVNNWTFSLFLDALVKRKAEVQRDVTRQDLMEVYHQVIRVSALEAINNSPETIDYYALQDIGLTQLVFERFPAYRQAIVEARKEGLLTVAAIQAVINEVNSQTLVVALERINNNRSGFSFADLVEVISWAKVENLEAYREAVSLQKTDITLTHAILQQIIGDVDRAVALEKINANPTNVSFDTLRDALAYVERNGNFTYYSFYRNAAVRAEFMTHFQAAIDAAEKPFTIDTLADVVIEVNENMEAIMIETINNNPSTVTFNTLNFAGLYNLRPEYLDQYRQALVKAVAESNEALTKQKLQNVILEVNQQQALANINANPLTFDMSDLHFAINVPADHNLLSYYQQEIHERRLAKGADLTKQEVEAAVNRVTNNIRVIALEKVNKETETLSFEWLQRVAHNARQEFMSQYRQALADRIHTSGWLAEYDVHQVIMNVDRNEVVKLINASAQFTYDDLAVVSIGREVRRELFNQYHAAIVSHENYGSLTAEQITKIIENINGQERLMEINNRPEALTSQQLGQLLNWSQSFRDENFTAYKEAIIDRVKNQGKPFATIAEVIELVTEINDKLVLKQINDQPLAVSQDALYLLFQNYESPWDFILWNNMNDYRQKFDEYVSNHGTLTKAKIEEIIHQVNQEAEDRITAERLAPIVTNLDGFYLHELAQLIGYENLLSNVEGIVERYRAALINEKNDGQELTKESILAIVLGVNDVVLKGYLDEINSNSGTIIYQHLSELVNYKQEYFNVNYSNLGLYQAEIARRLNAGETLTASDIREIVIGIETAIIDSKLALINNNPTGFTIDQLNEVVGWMGWDQHLNRYRQEVAAAVEKQGPLTQQQLIDLISRVNQLIREERLTVINNNPYTFTRHDLSNLVGTFKDERFEQYRNALSERIKDHGPLQEYQVNQILREVDQQIKIDALAKINKNEGNITSADISNALENESYGWFSSGNEQQYLVVIADTIKKQGPLTVQDLINIVNYVNHQVDFYATIYTNAPIMKGDTISVSTTRPGVFYFIRSEANVNITNEQDLQNLVNEGKGISQTNNHGWITLSTDGLESGEYIGYAVDNNGNLSLRTIPVQILEQYRAVRNVTTAYNNHNELISVSISTSKVQSGEVVKVELVNLDGTSLVHPVVSTATMNQFTAINIELRPSNGKFPPGKYYVKVTIGDDIEYLENRHAIHIRPAAPQVTADDKNNTIVGADGTMEYAIHLNGSWVAYDPASPPLFEGDQTIYVRYSETDKMPASEYTTLTFTADTVQVPEAIIFAELNLELDKYEDTATVAVTQLGDITELVIRLRDGVEVNNTITLQVTGEQLSSDYLLVNETTNTVYLENTSDITHSLTERLTLTFTKDGHSVSKTIYVTIKAEDHSQDLAHYVKSMMKYVEGFFISDNELQPWVSLEVVKKHMDEVDRLIAAFPELAETEKLLDRAYEILILANN